MNTNQTDTSIPFASSTELESLGEHALLSPALPGPCRLTAHQIIARSKKIVRAVNTIDEITAQRDALLAACKDLLAWLDGIGPCDGAELASHNKARAAIAQAERGSK